MWYNKVHVGHRVIEAFELAFEIILSQRFPILQVDIIYVIGSNTRFTRLYCPKARSIYGWLKM